MTISRVGVLVLLAAAMLGGCGISGCGIGGEATPRAIHPPRGAPGTAVSTAPSSAALPAPSGAATGDTRERLFFVRDGELVAVTRRVDGEPSVDATIGDLLAGPTDAEGANGITSALPVDGTAIDVRVHHGRASVELASTLDQGSRNDEVLGYAQLVCTLASRSDVTGVVFTHHGQQIGVPRADGALSEGPLSIDDYAALIVGGTPSPTGTEVQRR